MNPDDNISWDDYWNWASDGSCREPSEAELKELIAQGVVKEIFTETVDGYGMTRIEYQRAVNFCCNESPTKTIQVNMTEEPVVYAWSFVNDEWMYNGNVKN